MKRKIYWTTVIAAALACLVLFSMAACKKDSGAAAASSGPRARGSLPLVDTKTTVSLFLGESGNANVVSSYTYADNAFTKKVTDDTGIEFDFTIGSIANKREQLNVLLSAGNYPEILITDTLGYSELVYYAGQGIFKALDEYDPFGYPNIKAAFDEYPAMNEKLRSNDGKLYAFPSVNDCLHCIYSGGRMWYYLPWAQANNLKMPETLDEFTEYLRFIKNTDINGNGRRDEIPLAFEGRQYLPHFIAFMSKPFMPFVLSGDYFGLSLDNNKVMEQYKDPRFREALKYMTSLYSEGLILADSFSMTEDQLRAVATSDTPILGVIGSPWKNNYTVNPSVRFLEYFELRALEGPGGRHANNQDPWSIIVGSYFITDKAKDPELAVALYDYFINFDVQLDSYIGPKGVAWEDASPGTLSILNLPASHRMLASYGSQPFNATWDQAAPMIRNKKFRGGEEASGVPDMVDFLTNNNLSLLEPLLQNMSFTNEGFWYLTSAMNEAWALPQSSFIPPIAFSDDDNARISDINAVLKPYKEQAIVEFITGRRNINSDSDWNNYLSELDRNGSAEMAELIQKYIK
jgi:putative aldouronate transport system substrate-binding protein